MSTEKKYLKKYKILTVCFTVYYSEFLRNNLVIGIPGELLNTGEYGNLLWNYFIQNFYRNSTK